MIIITTARLRELVDTYLGELEDKGRSHHTVRAYRLDLDSYLDFLTATGRPANGRSASDYLGSLELASASLARRRTALTGWLASLAQAGNVVGSVEVTGPVRPERRDRSPFPSLADVEAVLARIPLQASRDQLLFGLLAHLGLRPGEALELRFEDFDEAQAALTVPGWGGRRRRVLVDDPVILMRLVNWRRASEKAGGPMFPGPKGTAPLSYTAAAKRWRRYESAAGVCVALGEVRLTHAAQLLEGGVPEGVVRARLGQQTGTLPGLGLSERQADDAVRAWRAASQRQPRKRSSTAVAEADEPATA